MTFPEPERRRAERLERDSENQSLRTRVEQLESELAIARVPKVATSVAGLTSLIDELLPLDIKGVDIVADEDLDGDLTLTLQGVTTDAHGALERRAIEFEVEATITIPVSMRVTSTSEDEAHDIAADTLRDIADDITSPASHWGGGVEDVGFDGFGITSEVDSVREV